MSIELPWAECADCGTAMSLADGCEWPDDEFYCWACAHVRLQRCKAKLAGRAATIRRLSVMVEVMGDALQSQADLLRTLLSDTDDN